jgi:acetolactate synthase-1/2/3 large subunit
MTTAEAVVAGLYANGIDTLFCLPGVQNDEFFAALYAYRDRIRLIHTRHEQGAAYMALGAAMATGKPAAYCVVPGPGFLNSTGALCTAYACNAPVLALTSQIPQAYIGRGLGFLHELPDQLGVMQRLTKWAERIREPQDAIPLVNEAFRQMTTGRPRPAGLECPLDVWRQSAEIHVEHPASSGAAVIDLPAVRRAAQLLRGAQRPLMVVGGGAQHAGDRVTAIAEQFQMPVIAGQMGFGVIDSRNPLSVNLQVGLKLWADADVVLAIGTRLQIEQMVWGLDDRLKIIRVDIDPDEIERFRTPAVGILGDSRVVLDALLAELETGERADRAVSPCLCPGERLPPTAACLSGSAARSDTGAWHLCRRGHPNRPRGTLRLSGLSPADVHFAGISGDVGLGLGNRDRRESGAARSPGRQHQR